MLGNRFRKIVNDLQTGRKVDERELESACLDLNQYELLKSYVAGLQNGGSRVYAQSVDAVFGMVFTEIYNTVLAVDVASIDIEIKDRPRHLFIMGSGRSTAAGTGTQGLWCQFNSDTGANYSGQYVEGLAAAATAAENINHSAGVHFGGLAQADHAAGKTASFFACVPHCSGALHKVALSFSMWPQSADFDARFQGEVWQNTNPVTALHLYQTSGNIAAGAAISVYGVN